MFSNWPRFVTIMLNTRYIVIYTLFIFKHPRYSNRHTKKLSMGLVILRYFTWLHVISHEKCNQKYNLKQK